MDSRQNHCAANAFTLIELLAVIGIIGLLAAMLLPSLSRAKGQAHSVYCKNNLRQMGMALTMYVQEHDNTYLPINTNWWAELEPYYPLKWTDPAYHCPGYKGTITARRPMGNPLGSYAYNMWGLWNFRRLVPDQPPLGLYFGLSEIHIASPSDMLAIGESRFMNETGEEKESDGIDILFCGFNEYVTVLPARHGNKYNQLFCDGHVAEMDRWLLFNPTNSARIWNNDHQPHPELW